MALQLIESLNDLKIKSSDTISKDEVSKMKDYLDCVKIYDDEEQYNVHWTLYRDGIEVHESCYGCHHQLDELSLKGVTSFCNFLPNWRGTGMEREWFFDYLFFRSPYTPVFEHCSIIKDKKGIYRAIILRDTSRTPVKFFTNALIATRFDAEFNYTPGMYCYVHELGIPEDVVMPFITIFSQSSEAHQALNLTPGCDQPFRANNTMNWKLWKNKTPRLPEGVTLGMFNHGTTGDYIGKPNPCNFIWDHTRPARPIITYKGPPFDTRTHLMRILGKDGQEERNEIIEALLNDTPFEIGKAK